MLKDTTNSSIIDKRNPINVPLDINVPSIEAPDLDTASFCRDESKDIFAEKKRAAWKDVQQAEARCDFAPNKVRISYRSSTKSLGSAKNPAFGIISLWKKSLYGRTLTEPWTACGTTLTHTAAVGINTGLEEEHFRNSVGANPPEGHTVDAEVMSVSAAVTIGP